MAFIICRSRSSASTSSSWPMSTEAWPARTVARRLVSDAPAVILATSKPTSRPSTWMGRPKASADAPSRSNKARMRLAPVGEVSARNSCTGSSTGTLGVTSPSGARWTRCPSSSSHSSPCVPASARLTSLPISERARSGSVGVSSLNAATASSVWMRPLVSATRREFSIATAACRAKSSAGGGSAMCVAACTEPIAPTSRSPYQRGIKLQAWPPALPDRTPVGASRQLSSELRPAHARTDSAAGSPLARVALMRPSVSNAQHATPADSSMVRAWSAMLETTLMSS